jgi:hypothetical protein
MLKKSRLFLSPWPSPGSRSSPRSTGHPGERKGRACRDCEGAACGPFVGDAVDLDHSASLRVHESLLPRDAMRSSRASRALAIRLATKASLVAGAMRSHFDQHGTWPAALLGLPARAAAALLRFHPVSANQHRSHTSVKVAARLSCQKPARAPALRTPRGSAARCAVLGE